MHLQSSCSRVGVVSMWRKVKPDILSQSHYKKCYIRNHSIPINFISSKLLSNLSNFHFFYDSRHFSTSHHKKGMKHTTPNNSSKKTSEFESKSDVASSSPSSSGSASNHNETSSTSSQPASSNSSTPPPPSPPLPSSSKNSSSRTWDMIFGAAFGLLTIEIIQYLMSFPDPLPSILNASLDDPLIQSQVGTPITRSPFWSGTVRPNDMATVVIPISGPNGKGEIFARALYEPSTRNWKLIYLQASIGGTPQRHTLKIPAHMSLEEPIQTNTHSIDSSLSSNQMSSIDHTNPHPHPPRSPLVLPANFTPSLLSDKQYEAYRKFLSDRGLIDVSKEVIQMVKQVENGEYNKNAQEEKNPIEADAVETEMEGRNLNSIHHNQEARL